MAQPFRIEPAMPVSAYKTYAISAPVQTHTRPATCAESDCVAWRNGWVTTVDVSTELGARQAKYITSASGRKYTMTEESGFARFEFLAGQKCFWEHRVPLDREPLLIVRDGDWRGNPTGRRRLHAKPADWVEDFQEHQGNLDNQLRRG